MRPAFKWFEAMLWALACYILIPNRTKAVAAMIILAGFFLLALLIVKAIILLSQALHHRSRRS